ncbi:MAG: type II toxin-antitoxin system VapC family toxin [Roseateles sp.]|uniref:type II toxin-antitoxin system VapC family toxin n=1 Tax=Roseateles sp. TaxID=1971397 RepID=UPI0039E8EDC7
MTRLLLDTHILVWFAHGDERVGPHARAAINRAAAAGALHLSAISAWEVAMLVAKGRLALAQDVEQWLDEALARLNLRLEALSVGIAVASSRLPGMVHGDPADRILAATARALGAALVTVDEKLLDYARAGHLLALDGSI